MFHILNVSQEINFVSLLTYHPYSQDQKLIVFNNESDLLEERYRFLDSYISVMTNNELYFSKRNSSVKFTKKILENVNISSLCGSNRSDERCKRKVKAQVNQALNQYKLFDLFAKIRVRPKV